MKKGTGRRASKRGIRISLSLMFAAMLFVIFLVTMVVVAAITMILSHYGILIISGSWSGASRFVIYLAIASVILGTLLSFGAGNIPLWPVNYLVNAMNQLAEGDYSVRLHTKKSWGEISFVKETMTSFNKLAEELNNTQMLRSDFVNNFSHEFKTPIVSINGFAKLLLQGELSEQEQREYLEIIAAESGRLAHMANNVLDLTRIENQQILTNIREFNLSELIRTCALLLEPKWSKKNVFPVLDFDEYTISGNSDLLQHAFINLMDNAIKFSPEESEFSITIEALEEDYRITVTNHGPDIPHDILERIFEKFYQGDQSHSAEGNGIGLAVVRQVAILHQGEVSVRSGNGTTEFILTLPKKQNLYH